MAKIIAYEYTDRVKVGIEVELYDGTGSLSVMVTAHHGHQTVPVPLDADQADQLAREIAAVAAELRARQVAEIGGV